MNRWSTTRRGARAAVLAAVGAAALAATAGAVPAPTGYTLTASPGTGAFGSVGIGKTAALDFTITGTMPTFTSVSITPSTIVSGLPLATPPAVLSGTGAAEFSIDATAPNACAADRDVITAPCVVRVVFTPTSAGDKTASLTVTANPVTVADVTSDPCGYAAGSLGTRGLAVIPCTVTVPLTGTAVAPTPAAPVIGAAVTPKISRTRVGDRTRITVVTSNPGTTTLANVRTTLTIPTGFAVVGTGGGTRSGRTITWTARSLAGAASASYRATLQALSTSARIAGITVTSAGDGATASASARLLVRRAKPRLPVTG